MSLGKDNESISSASGLRQWKCFWVTGITSDYSYHDFLFSDLLYQWVRYCKNDIESGLDPINWWLMPWATWRVMLRWSTIGQTVIESDRFKFTSCVKLSFIKWEPSQTHVRNIQCFLSNNMSEILNCFLLSTVFHHLKQNQLKIVTSGLNPCNEFQV